VINFRYHVVSLVAVFVALSIELVVGAAALDGPAADHLQEQAAGLRQANDELQGELGGLRGDVAGQERFAEEAATLLLPGRLSGRRTAVVVLPGGGDLADGVVRMLATAGARVTGRIQLRDPFLDPDRDAELLDIAARSVPPSVANALPTNADGLASSAALLAAVVLQRTPAVADDDVRSVLAAYASQEYLTVAGGTVAEPAEVVVLVSGPPAAGDRNRNAVTVVGQFAKGGTAVLAAASAAGDGNVVSAVRADPNLADSVSTVDNAGTPQGRLSVPLAVAERLAGRTGHYGTGGGTALIPKPAP
jgi:hypothetical protein